MSGLSSLFVPYLSYNVAVAGSAAFMAGEMLSNRKSYLRFCESILRKCFTPVLTVSSYSSNMTLANRTLSSVVILGVRIMQWSNRYAAVFSSSSLAVCIIISSSAYPVIMEFIPMLHLHYIYMKEQMTSHLNGIVRHLHLLES